MQCPGQDTRYWSGDAVFEAPCPKCGASVEFFKDDSQRRCGNCGHRFPNPRLDFGCAAYCPFAAQCLGALPEEMKAKREELLRERLLAAVREHPGANGAAWRAAEQAAELAGEIGGREGAALAVVLAGALLYDYAPQAARALLDELKVDGALRESILSLLTGQTPDNQAGSEPRVVHDARHIVEHARQWQEMAPTTAAVDEALAALRTVNGREIARREWNRFCSN
jgi:hypothetical protein